MNSRNTIPAFHQFYLLGERAIVQLAPHGSPTQPPPSAESAPQLPTDAQSLFNAMGAYLAQPDLSHPSSEPALAAANHYLAALVPHLELMSREHRTHVISVFRRNDGSYCALPCVSYPGHAELGPSEVWSGLVRALTHPEVHAAFARQSWAHDSTFHEAAIESLMSRRTAPPRWNDHSLN